MRGIYEIDNDAVRVIESGTDLETGELTEDAIAQLDALQMEREAKIESLAICVKNYAAQEKAIRDEAKALTARADNTARKVASLKQYLQRVLNNTPFATSKVGVRFRHTKRVEVDSDFEQWARVAAPELMRIKAEPDKAKIKQWITNGASVSHASLVDAVSMSVR